MCSSIVRVVLWGLRRRMSDEWRGSRNEPYRSSSRTATNPTRVAERAGVRRKPQQTKTASDSRAVIHDEVLLLIFRAIRVSCVFVMRTLRPCASKAGWCMSLVGLGCRAGESARAALGARREAPGRFGAAAV